jgi:RNA polymerase sigma factor (sigma-70 family)
MDDVIQQIRHLAEGGRASPFTDQQLLERFLSRRDEAAFAALVRRHGPMILGLCRRLLQHVQDAEDVFQASFLVLARKAASIRKQESVGSWLYGVAYRLAKKTKVEAAKRRARTHPSPLGGERTGVRGRGRIRSQSDPLAEISWREVCTALDEELARLPDRWRAPLVLCYLESKTQDEALQQLGWSKSTFRRRLEEGRKKLCSRLTRRGITLSAGLWATLLSDQGASAAILSPLSQSTVQAAIAFAAGEIAAGGTAVTPVSAQVALLAKEGLKVTAMSKMKVVALLGMVIVLTTGIGLAAHQALKANQGNGEPKELFALPDEPRPQPKPEKGNEARVDRYGDPLPEGAMARLGTVRFRHGDLINSLAFTPDGKQLLSQSDNVVRLWDAATGRELGHVTVEPYGWVGELLVTRDGKFVFTMERGGQGNSIRFRNRSDLKVVREFNVGSLETPQLSPDGKLLAGLEQNKSISTVEIWDMATGKRLRSWKAHDGWIWSYEFSADGKTLVTGGKDKVIRFWDVATGRLEREITGHPKDVHKLALSADGTMLATLSTSLEWYYPWDNFVRIWDVASGKETRRLTMPLQKRFGDQSLGFNTLAFDPVGQTLVTAGQDDMLRFWNPSTGTELRSISLGSRTYVGMRATAALAFAPDGKTLAVGTNAIRLLDTASGRDVSTFGGHRAGVFATATTDGTTAFTAGREGNVVIWDLATGKERARLDGRDQTITAIATLGSGRRLLTCGLDTALFMVTCLWDMTTNQELRRIDTPSWDPRADLSLALSPDERTLAVPGKDNSVALIDLETGKEWAKVIDFETSKQRVKVGPHDEPASGAAFHPDGNTLMVWCRNHTAHVWDLKTARKVRQFEFADLPPSGNEITHMFTPLPPSGKGGRSGYSYAAALSPGGRYIAYGSLWNYLAIHEVLTGKTVRLIDKLEPDGVGTLAFSPDGRMLAWSGWQQPRIHLLELATGKERHHFDGHKARVTSLTFSSDGRTLISGSEDTTAIVWDLTDKLSQKKSPLDLDTAWHELAGTDAARAYQAMRRLAALPTETIPYLRNQVQPFPVLNEKRLAGLIADLDSNRFAVREKATKDLEHLGEAAVGACRMALQAQPSAEVRRRLEGILEKEAKSASAPSPERLRALRAIEVLEHIGTPLAQDVLNSLAHGAPEARPTQEAKASLERLSKRSSAPP